MGRRIRRLRNRLGLSQEAFARAYGIPLASIRQYEIGRHMPPPAVRAYLKVIDGEPEAAARAVSAKELPRCPRDSVSLRRESVSGT